LKRFEELDSLRGIAAFTVMIEHFLLIFPLIYHDNDSLLLDILKYTPLHIFWAGHEAVIFFFILSGFVLSLPYLSNKGSSYSSYLIKRICRIYIPYLLAVTVAVFARISLYSGEIPGLSEWFNNLWKSELSVELLLGHLIMIGSFKNDAIDPVLWSLVQEMRISILFPLVFYLISKFNWKTNLGICFILSSTWFFLQYKALEFETDYFITMHYFSMFVFGGLLARYREAIISSFWQKLTKNYQALLLCFACLCYTYSEWFFPGIGKIHVAVINDWVIALGVCLFIMIALSAEKVSAVLTKRPFIYLGRISYSLYLLHGITLLTLINALHNWMPIEYILFFSLIGSLAVSTIFYYLVEIPSMKLGRYLSGIIVKRELKRSVAATLFK